MQGNFEVSLAPFEGKMRGQRKLVHTTCKGVGVYVEPGSKKPWDFRVSHSTSAGSPYTVFHRDFILEIYRRRVVVPRATDKLIDHFIEVIEHTKGVTRLPPALVQFSLDSVNRFSQLGLDDVGQYDLELLFVLFELVQIQEETNYPGGWVPTKLYKLIRDNGDNLAEVAYLTEVVVSSRENSVTLKAQDKLLSELRNLVRK